MLTHSTCCTQLRTKRHAESPYNLPTCPPSLSTWPHLKGTKSLTWLNTVDSNPPVLRPCDSGTTGQIHWHWICLERIYGPEVYPELLVYNIDRTPNGGYIPLASFLCVLCHLAFLALTISLLHVPIQPQLYIAASCSAQSASCPQLIAMSLTLYIRPIFLYVFPCWILTC